MHLPSSPKCIDEQLLSTLLHFSTQTSIQPRALSRKYHFTGSLPKFHNQEPGLNRMIVTPYSSDAFNTLLSLDHARELFTDRYGEDGVQHLLDLIEQQGMEQKFGVILLHRHLDL